MSEPPGGSAAQPGLIERHTDAIGSAVLVCDADGVIVDCNRAAIELLGFSKSELVGRSIADAEWLSVGTFAEDGRPLDEFSVPALADLRAGRSIPPTVVGAHVQGQSEPMWILVCAEPLPPDDQGHPAGAVLTVTDITAQKRAEALYAAVADELHGVLHALPDLYFMLDAAGLVVDYSIGSGFDAFVTSDNFVGRRPEEFLPGDFARAMHKAIAAARLSREVQTFEIGLETPAAGLAFFEGRVVALPDGAAVVLVRDMTEQRQAEQELARSERLYRSFFERASVGIFIFDPGLQVTGCNEAFMNMTGRSRDDFDGVDLARLGDQSLAPALTAALAGEESSYDGPYLQDGARSGIISLRTQPVFDENGTVVGGIGVIARMSQLLATEGRE